MFCPNQTKLHWCDVNIRDIFTDNHGYHRRSFYGDDDDDDVHLLAS